MQKMNHSATALNLWRKICRYVAFQNGLRTESLFASDTSMVGCSCMTIMSKCRIDPTVPLDLEVDTGYVVATSGNVA